MRKWFLISLLLVSASLGAQQTYRKPPAQILDVLNAPSSPQAFVSPPGEAMLLARPVRYPAIADLAQPMLGLAGMRVNPDTNGPDRETYFVSLSIVRIADGVAREISLPSNPRIGWPVWSPDGKRFAFRMTAAAAVELWVADVLTAEARKLGGHRLNAAFTNPVQWMPDSRALLVRLIPSSRGAPPREPRVSPGPNIQESYGRTAPVWTFPDLLRNEYLEKCFDYYITSQLALVDPRNARAIPVGNPAIFTSVQPSPNGEFLLVTYLHRPYSRLHSNAYFPREVEVWDLAGRLVYKVASHPAMDSVPTGGVQTGPRMCGWRPTQPATLVWVEALDGGDPKRDVSHRDRVLMLRAPFAGSPYEILRTEHRLTSLSWFRSGGRAIATDHDSSRHRVRGLLTDADAPGIAPRILWSRDPQDGYADIGLPVARMLPNGQVTLLGTGDSIFLSGEGASPDGDRPFLDRLDVGTLRSERLFRSASDAYEYVIFVAAGGTKFITRRETSSEPRNFLVRGVAGDIRALTRFQHPAPRCLGIRKQLVTYKRKDGVQLSFTLHLPPDHKDGVRLPAVLWAYPFEYSDSSTASQLRGSAQRFTMFGGASPLFLTLDGYAVLYNTAMPIVGTGNSANDNYIDQIVANAEAAVQKAVEMGFIDPDRVGVGGYSYGACMAASLLAHSKLFRAGVAFSGAYNRTLTPFGFQKERRTLWQIPDVYMKMSPFMYADQIKQPLLLVHGEADENIGTFPIQSERMYQAIRGNGGNARLVMLPHEGHGYMARESVEHVLWEMSMWFDKYVKNASPR